VCVCVCARTCARSLKTAQIRVLELVTAWHIVLETGDLFADNLA